MIICYNVLLKEAQNKGQKNKVVIAEINGGRIAFKNTLQIAG